MVSTFHLYFSNVARSEFSSSYEYMQYTYVTRINSWLFVRLTNILSKTVIQFLHVCCYTLSNERTATISQGKVLLLSFSWTRQKRNILEHRLRWSLVIGVNIFFSLFVCCTLWNVDTWWTNFSPIKQRETMPHMELKFWHFSDFTLFSDILVSFTLGIISE